MRYVYVLIVLTLTACGKQNSSTPVTVDPALAPYMASFETDIGASSDGISAQFADTSVYANPLGETVGECTIWSDGTRLIQIDPIYWNTLTQNGKIQLMYHELGHCALYMQHIVTESLRQTSLLWSSICPDSIMYPTTFGETDCYSYNMGYYFTELGSHK